MSHSRPLFLYFRLFFVQLTANNCSIKVTYVWIRTRVLWYEKLAMTGFEPGSSDIRSGRAVNCATTTAQLVEYFASLPSRLCCCVQRTSNPPSPQKIAFWVLKQKINRSNFARHTFCFIPSTQIFTQIIHFELLFLYILKPIFMHFELHLSGILMHFETHFYTFWASF